jgi:8-oxo-dGTP pyrophosphatase MutT (NUDIX family)
VRAGFRLAYRLARVYWLVLRPDVVGVKAVIRDGGRVLLVRHTYGDRGAWEVPGGHARSDEEPALAVRREMFEELGVDIAEWRLFGALTGRSDAKRERVHCFVAAAPDAPIHLARGEISEAQWFALDALPAPVGALSMRALAMLRQDRARIQRVS